MGYKEDLRLERKFAGTVKQILGLHFFQQDRFADQKEGTDFLILAAANVRIGCRIRTHYYLEYFRDQFTIRWERPSGIATEIHKIRRGLVTHLFYGFCDEAEQRLIQYFIADAAYLRFENIQPIAIKENNPPDSKLAAYALTQFPPAFICHYWALDGHQLNLGMDQLLL